MEDRFAIQQGIYRSAAALDTGDVEGFVAVWAAGAVFELDVDGRPHARFAGHDELRGYCEMCRPWGVQPANGVYHVTAVLFEEEAVGLGRTRSTVLSTMQLGD